MIRNWNAVWALLALIAVVGLGWWQVGPSPPLHGNAAGYSSERTTHDKNPSADYVAPALAVGLFLDGHNGAVNAVATILISIFTIVLASKTSALFKATAGLEAAARQQARDTAESLRIARETADAAKDAAGAAVEQIGIAKKTAETPLRAYLAIGSIDVERKSGWVRIQVLNKGKTPANNVTFHYGREWSERDTSFEWSTDNKPDWQQIAPDEHNYIFALYDLDMSISGEATISIRVTILYDDWFDNPHRCVLSFVVGDDDRILDRRYKTD